MSRSVAVTVWLAVALPALVEIPAGAQTPGTYKVISTKDSKLQEELDRAAADGFRIVLGDAGVSFLVLERVPAAPPRSYLYVKDAERFLKDNKLKPGYQLVTPTFGGDGYLYYAVFEKAEGDEQSRGYRVSKAGSGGGLRKRFEEGGEGSSGAVAIASSPGAAVVYEARPEAGRGTIIASGNTGTLQQELTAAAGRGQCIVDGDGVKEAVYLLQNCPAGSGPRKYEVISTTKTETLEKELNDAAARGMRLVAPSLVGIEKRVMMQAYNNEAVAVVESVSDAAPLTYRVIGVARKPTFEKELQEAAAAGFKLIAFTIGPKEIVAVLEKPRSGTGSR